MRVYQCLKCDICHRTCLWLNSNHSFFHSEETTNPSNLSLCIHKTVKKIPRFPRLAKSTYKELSIVQPVNKKTIYQKIGIIWMDFSVRTRGLVVSQVFNSKVQFFNQGVVLVPFLLLLYGQTGFIEENIYFHLWFCRGDSIMVEMHDGKLQAGWLEQDAV